MIAVLIIVALLLPLTNDSWDIRVESGQVRAQAIRSTADLISTGTLDNPAFSSANDFDIARDCTYLWRSDNVRELSCGPTTGRGNFYPIPGGWTIYDGGGEPVYAGLESEPKPLLLTWADVAVLPIQSGDVQLYPSGERRLINVETIGQSTAATHTLTTTILDTPVEIQLTPLEWTWNFGQTTPSSPPRPQAARIPISLSPGSTPMSPRISPSPPRLHGKATTELETPPPGTQSSAPARPQPPPPRSKPTSTASTSSTIPTNQAQPLTTETTRCEWAAGTASRTGPQGRPSPRPRQH